MRVAYICADPGIPVFGTKGASVHVQEIVRAFLARGADVTVYCTRRGDQVPDDLAGVPILEQRVPRASGPWRETAQAAAAALLAAAATADGADLVYERYSLFSTALAEVTAALSIPGVLEVNAPLIDEQRAHRYLSDEETASAVLRRQAAAAARTVCVSGPVAEWVIGRGGHRKTTLVVPNGVNVDRIRPGAGSPGVPVVVFVGTLKPWHGVSFLIDAAARARQPWRLRIVGDGPEGPALRAQAAAAGVEAEFTGALAPCDIPAVLGDCAVAVAPYPVTADSSSQYFSPLKIYEYCAAGLPVVASSVGQIPEILQDGRTGVLVPGSDPGALAAAVDGLIADPVRRRAMSAAARQSAETRHGWNLVLEKSLAGVAA